MKKVILKVIMVFTLTTMIYSCYPGGNNDIEDLDTATTVYKPADFSPAPKSAMMVWNVAQLRSEDHDDIPYHGEIDDEILNTTLDNLVDLYGAENVYIFSITGTPTPEPNNSQVRIITPNDFLPDFDAGIIPSIVLRKKTEVGWVWPPYPWWGCYYCWYTPVPYIIDYEVGSVLVSLMDHRQNDADLEPSWLAVTRGIPSGSTSFDGDRTASGINQAFEQSPYLK